MNLLYLIYQTIFVIKYNNNLLYCNNYFYKCGNFGDNIAYINIHIIIKKLYLNYFIMLEYKILYINQIIENKIGKKNAKSIFFK